MIVRIKSPSRYFTEWFVIATEETLQQAIKMSENQIERIYNSLNYGSDEETEFESQKHEVIVLDEKDLKEKRIQKREKDEDVFIFGPY